MSLEACPKLKWNGFGPIQGDPLDGPAVLLSRDQVILGLSLCFEKEYWALYGVSLDTSVYGTRQ